MKKLIYINLSILILCGLVACSDFGDLNVNPNKPTEVSTATLLTNAERTVSSVVGNITSVLYAQHVASITYTDASRYSGTQADFSGWYNGALEDLERVIDLNTDEATKDAASASGLNENQIAAATILKYYFIHVMTDRWGPLPWSEALQAEDGIFTPGYDSQEAIYMDLFDGLKAAAAMIDESSAIDGDFIMGGDMSKWKQFAATIRLVAALRLSDVAPTQAETEFNAALAAGVLSSDLFYPYLAETANQNPWYGSFVTRTDYAISENFVSDLQAIGDPRLTHFADTALTPGLGIVGMPYGLANSEYKPEDVSYPNSTYVKAQDSPLAIYTVAQIKFSMAEAAARGWITDDAETLYKEGIQASWDQWYVTDGDFDAYYMQPEVMYDATEWKEKIAFQKWIALFLQGYEAFAEFRRLDAPALMVPEEPFSHTGDIPKRWRYPSSEADLNAVNYEEAVRMLNGPDEDSTPLWWDVN